MGGLPVARLLNDPAEKNHLHVHKICGLTCLVHFCYRFSFGARVDMGFTPSAATLVLLTVHLLLSCSSMIFKLPLARINHGIRIWPEFRLHSIIFASRYILVLAGLWCEARMQGSGRFPQQPCWGARWWANVLIVFASMKLAEKATRLSHLREGKPPSAPSNSVRGIDAPDAYKYIFSVFQFHETATVLLSSFVPLFCIPFGILFVIQFTAFGMTLQRKNLAPHKLLTHVYMVVLVWFVLCVPVLAFPHATRDVAGAIYALHTVGNVAAVMRLWFEIGRYRVWLAMSAGIFCASTCLSAAQLAKLGAPACYASWAAVAAVGVPKVTRVGQVTARRSAKEFAQRI